MVLTEKFRLIMALSKEIIDKEANSAKYWNYKYNLLGLVQAYYFAVTQGIALNTPHDEIHYNFVSSLRKNILIYIRALLPPYIIKLLLKTNWKWASKYANRMTHQALFSGGLYYLVYFALIPDAFSRFKEVANAINIPERQKLTERVRKSYASIVIPSVSLTLYGDNTFLSKAIKANSLVDIDDLLVRLSNAFKIDISLPATNMTFIPVKPDIVSSEITDSAVSPIHKNEQIDNAYTVTQYDSYPYEKDEKPTVTKYN